jgi:molecular chaperone IbpA
MSELHELLRHTLGLSVFGDQARWTRASAYPPCNIYADNAEAPTAWRVVVAVAGFSKEELKVLVKRVNGVKTLIIEGSKGDESYARDMVLVDGGIAYRRFQRHFSMGENVKIKEVNLVDGILTIDVESTEPKETDQVIAIK